MVRVVREHASSGGAARALLVKSRPDVRGRGRMRKTDVMPGSRQAMHPQLIADCHLLGASPSGRVLLHANAQLPWLILVPDTEAADLLQLPRAQRIRVLDDCERLDLYLRTRWVLDKVNFAAIGNLVPQLHLHLVGRRRDDCCWPLPAWGHLQQQSAYPAAEVEVIGREISALWN